MHFCIAVISKTKEDSNNIINQFYEGLEVRYSSEWGWYNPNGFFDWCVEGGRFIETLKVKNLDDEDNEKGVFTDPVEIIDYNGLVSCKVSNILDVEKLSNEIYGFVTEEMEDIKTESDNDFKNLFNETIKNNLGGYITIYDCHG